MREYSSNEFTCCICLQDLNRAGNKTSIRCGHSFHRKCIQEWTKRKPSCPICRAEIPLYIPRRTQEANRNVHIRRNTIQPMEDQWNLNRFNGLMDQRGVNLIDLTGENLSLREILITIIIILICIILVILYNEIMKSCLCDKQWEPYQTYKIEYKWYFATPTTFSRPPICCYIC